MKKTSMFAIAAVISLMAIPAVGAEKDEAKEEADLAKGMKAAKVSLQQGLSASEREGTPISAKYELEEGKLQLSVYTMKGDKFSEVIVDHKTGKVAKAEPITSGDDLTAAKAQKETMADAKVSLGAAADRAVKENKGYRAISITPATKDGHPYADVTLVKGDEFKKVWEKLN